MIGGERGGDQKDEFRSHMRDKRHYRYVCLKIKNTRHIRHTDQTTKYIP